MLIYNVIFALKNHPSLDASIGLLMHRINFFLCRRSIGDHGAPMEIILCLECQFLHAKQISCAQNIFASIDVSLGRSGYVHVFASQRDFSDRTCIRISFWAFAKSKRFRNFYPQASMLMKRGNYSLLDHALTSPIYAMTVNTHVPTQLAGHETKNLLSSFLLSSFVN